MNMPVTRAMASSFALPQLIYERLTRSPEAQVATFVDDDGGSVAINARQLTERAMAYAHSLGSVDRSKARIAGICLYHGIDLHAAFVGALWSGHIPTMIAPPSARMEPDRYATNFRGLLAHVRPEVVVLDRSTKENLEAHGLGDIGGLALLDVGSVDGAESTTPVDCGMDDVVLLQHSSGTTGLQKGVALNSRQALAHNRAYVDCLGMTDEDVVATWLPLYHDMGFIACFLMPLLNGLHIVEMSPFAWVRRPMMLLEQIHRHEATLCWLPNFAFSFMADQFKPERVSGELDLSSVRAWVNSSEPVMAASMHAFVKTFAPFGVCKDQMTTSYAMAENVYAVTQSQPGHLRSIRIDAPAFQLNRVERSDAETAREFVSCGPAVSGTEIRVIGPDDAILNEGYVGEICLRGDYVFDGYYERDDLTDLAMTEDGWYRTGDVGFVEQGEIFVTGRKKDLIIIQGRNFHPSDFEEAAGLVPGAIKGRIVAFGVTLPDSGTEGVVILTESDGTEHEKRLALQIRKRISQEFDCTPSDVRVVPTRWLIKSTSGKLARAANRDKYLEASST
jgi:fatty-acyl-CoA synthase